VGESKMTNEERPIEELFFASGKGKYEVTKLAIDWIKVKKNDDGYKNLSQAELLDKAVRDVLSGEATYEKIEEINKKREAEKEEKQEENAAN
jgi:hypothetical protein